jgi:hypothetical protein
MDEQAPLKVTHDVSQTLQRKIEGKCYYTEKTSCIANHRSGLEDVERAFVHVSPDSYRVFHDLTAFRLTTTRSMTHIRSTSQ